MSGQERYTIIDIRGTRQTVAQGMTTDAPTGLPAFKNPIKEFLCIVMCACKKIFAENQKVPELQTDDEVPSVDAAAALPETAESASTKPPKLQQNCVSTLFQSLDKAADYHSPLKAEVWFDMDGYRAGFRNIGDKVPNRPQPLMSRNTPTKPMHWHWGVISHVGRRKNPLLSQPTFTKGGVSLRRPDIVIVRNPARPPEESNIAMIYELKFDEKPDKLQLEAYRKIVNYDRLRVGLIEVKDCRCEKRNERIREVTREELMTWAAAMTAALGESDNDRSPPDLAPAQVNTGLALLAAIALGVVAVAALPVEVPAGVAAFIAMMLGVGTAATR